MYERAYRLGGMKWLAGLIALLVMAIIFAAVAYVDPRPGDCWGGILSDDPLHCYVLEEAKRAGVIQVDAMYRAGTELFVYLDQSDPVSDDVYRYLQRKAQARVSLVGGDDCVLEPRGCSGGVFWYSPMGGYILPYLDTETDYVDIELKHGGADARRSEPGWAAFRQVWPAAVGTGGASGATRSSGFDVSGVDTTNFPTLDCLDDNVYYDIHQTLASCQKALDRYAGFGIAGVHSMDGKIYVQVKASSVDDVRAQTVKQVMTDIPVPPSDLDSDNWKKHLPTPLPIGVEPTERAYDVVIIPVKYSYEDLLRWKIVLTRFIHSSGNTVGIIQAAIETNTVDSVVGRVALPNDSLQPASTIPGYGYDRATIRETIWVVGLNLEQTQRALPQLLKQLNIPVDAVGVVGEPDQTPHKLGTRYTPGPGPVVPLGGWTSGPSASSPKLLTAESMANLADYVSYFWPYLLGIVAAFVLLVSMVILGIRRLRRRYT